MTGIGGVQLSAADTTMYNPVTGLIDLGGIQAKSIDSLVINGAISALTNNPYDTSVTNDFRSVINVSGRIGSVVGLRSSLSGAIRADSIGSVRVANIAGEITTRNAADDFAIDGLGAIGIVSAAGIGNLEDSSAIVESTFEAANIGNIYADVQTVEGGNAIFGSTLTSKGATVEAVRLFKTAAAQPAPTTTPAKRKRR